MRQARRVGLLGLGTVGSAVAARLLDPDWRANAVARGHVPPVLVAVAARDAAGERKLELPPEVRLSDDATSVADRGGRRRRGRADGWHGRRLASAIRRGLRGRQVGGERQQGAAGQGRGRPRERLPARPGVGLRFEAAVAGGVPLLGPLVWDLGANRVTAVRGIVNGTTNHILSTMAADGREYGDVLREAQARGFAEADPSSDVEGLDAAYKLTLLTRLAFDGWLDVATLRRSIPVFGAAAPRRHHGRHARPPRGGCPPGPGHQAHRTGRAHVRRAGIRAAVTPMAVASRLAAGRHARASPTSSSSRPTRWAA